MCVTCLDCGSETYPIGSFSLHYITSVVQDRISGLDWKCLCSVIIIWQTFLSPKLKIALFILTRKKGNFPKVTGTIIKRQPTWLIMGQRFKQTFHKRKYMNS